MQLDEKWSFVAKKEAHVEAGDAQQQGWGDDWDHTAIDPEHRLLLAVVPGKRTLDSCKKLVQQVKQRTGGRPLLYLTSSPIGGYREVVRQTSV